MFPIEKFANDGFNISGRKTAKGFVFTIRKCGLCLSLLEKPDGGWLVSTKYLGIMELGFGSLDSVNDFKRAMSKALSERVQDIKDEYESKIGKIENAYLAIDGELEQ